VEMLKYINDRKKISTYSKNDLGYLTMEDWEFQVYV